MDVYHDLAALPPELKGQTIGIGNFDGVHLGHRALLAQAKKTAKGTKLGILTFEPHPGKLFRPDSPPFRITPPDLKYRLLREAGADFIVSLPFNWDFASQTAEAFVQGILKDGLEAKSVIVGEDFRFGQLRKGSAETIRTSGIDVRTITPVGGEDTRRYSSSLIREALRSGDIDGANAMLGWRWEVSGTIFRGDRRGHALGYPTANILLGDVLHPAYGIYACEVMIEGEDQWRAAATNIGIRPMFEVKEGQIEAHILDFPDTDLYDGLLRVRPVKRLRGEAKFASLDDLKTQMALDCDQTRRILTK